MKKNNSVEGKVSVILLVILFIILAFAGGYYLSLTRFTAKSNKIADEFTRFEEKYEMILTEVRSDIAEIHAYIQEKEGKSEESVNKIHLAGSLLKGKGEIISARIHLAQDDTEKAVAAIDSAIAVLKEAMKIIEPDGVEAVENLRLELATIKGIIEANRFKAQENLEKAWREIDRLLENYL